MGYSGKGKCSKGGKGGKMGKSGKGSGKSGKGSGKGKVASFPGKGKGKGYIGAEVRSGNQNGDDSYESESGSDGEASETEDADTGVGSSESGTLLFCEPCDKEFTSAVAQAAHLKTHVPCYKPGCGFVASKRVVSAHFESTHGQFSGTGYKTVEVEVGKTMVPFRVLMGTSPEEVAQWRAERRKNWPTKENLDAKADAAAARNAHGYLDSAGSGKGRLGKGGKGKLAQKRGRPDVPGTSDEKKPKLEAEGALGDLMAAYADSGDEDGEEFGVSASANDDEAEEAADGAVSTLPHKGNKACEFWLHTGKCRNGDDCGYRHDENPPVCSYFVGGKCTKGRSCTYAHNMVLVKAARQARKEGGKGPEGTTASAAGPRKGKASASGVSAGSSSTLLRKLLDAEVRRERSLMLQCLRFFVDTDFLSSTTTARTSAASLDSTIPATEPE